jgi:broad specificity phosphatase PhoE
MLGTTHGKRARLLRALLLGCIFMLSACTTRSVNNTHVAVEYIVVRHAEKGTDDARDPSLSEVGKARARALATVLADTPLHAAYATAYQRTQQTAQPTASSHGLSVMTYDAKLPATTFVAQLRATHTKGAVLVVGHSNTVPEIVTALSGHAVEPMPETMFDRLYRITIDSTGTATLVQERY